MKLLCQQQSHGEGEIKRKSSSFSTVQIPDCLFSEKYQLGTNSGFPQ